MASSPSAVWEPSSTPSINQLGQNLRFVNTTLSQVLDIGKTLTTDLSTAASSYLAANANAAATL
jgi:hypothetical protein